MGGLRREIRWWLAVWLLWPVLGLADRADDGAARIGDFAIYVPRAPVLCGEADPWRGGHWRLRAGGAVPSGGCLSLRFALAAEAHVVLLHEDPAGRLTRLWPDDCAGDKPLAAGAEHHYPTPRAGAARVLEFDRNTGIERFHLLAIAPGPAGEPLRRRLRTLASLPGGCARPAAAALSAAAPGQPAATLENWLAIAGAAVQRQTLAIEHY